MAVDSPPDVGQRHSRTLTESLHQGLRTLMYNKIRYETDSFKLYLKTMLYNGCSGIKQFSIPESFVAVSN